LPAGWRDFFPCRFQIESGGIPAWSVLLKFWFDWFRAIASARGYESPQKATSQNQLNRNWPLGRLCRRGDGEQLRSRSFG
jgi:hypothetical protein